MTDEPRQTTPRPILRSISAQLFVANIKSSCNFYTNKLGFAVEFIYGDPPYYGQLFRDNARLALRLVCEPVFVCDVRKREHLLSASITVDTANEIKQLFLSYQAAGVSFHQALKKEPWGAAICTGLEYIQKYYAELSSVDWHPAMNGKWKSSFASIPFSSQAICHDGSCIGGTGDGHVIRADRAQRELRQRM